TGNQSQIAGHLLAAVTETECQGPAQRPALSSAPLRDGFAAVAPPAPAPLLARAPGSIARWSRRGDPRVPVVLAGSDWSKETATRIPARPALFRSTTLSCVACLRSWRWHAVDSSLGCAFPPGDAGAISVGVHRDSLVSASRYEESYLLAPTSVCAGHPGHRSFACAPAWQQS